MKTVNVTKRDIKLGEKMDAHACPVARALKRVYPKKDFGVVSTGVVIRSPKAKWVSLPESAVFFIRRFDNQRPVQPFKFKIKL